MPAAPGSAPAGGSAAGPKAFPRVALDLATTVERIQQNFVISDPSLPDCPIVFASDAFLELTEYPREEVLGRNCRFLQGPGTDQATIQTIRDAIKAGAETTVRILNYTRSGRPFWNMFTIAPMLDHDGTTRFFVGVQVRSLAGGGGRLIPAGTAFSCQSCALGPAALVLSCSHLAVLVCPTCMACPSPAWKQHSASPHATLTRARAHCQVDVTANADAAASDKLPAWTATSVEEQAGTKAGTQAAMLISSALQSMGWGANPWAGLGGSLVHIKPHQAGDRAMQVGRGAGTGKGCAAREGPGWAVLARGVLRRMALAGALCLKPPPAAQPPPLTTHTTTHARSAALPGADRGAEARWQAAPGPLPAREAAGRG